MSGLETVSPRYGEASLADLFPGALAALGVPGSSDPIGLSTGPLAGVRKVAVLLVDGLGHHQLPIAAPRAPALAALAADSRSRTLTSGFPSTTPTSLASLGTGAAPGAHGLVGFLLNVPGTDRVLNHIRWDDDPDPLRWQPLRTQFDVAADHGVASYVVAKPEFAGSGLTTAAWRGGQFVGAADPEAVAARMLHALATAPAPALVYGYVPDVDRWGHETGVGSAQWFDAVRDVDRMVARLVEGLPADAALLVTADHGQLNVAGGRRVDVDTEPGLRDGLRVLAGEPRVRYLHTLPGAADDVLATWRGVLGGDAWVLPRDEAVAEGLFGPVSEAHLQRVGDVVAICRDRTVLLATQTSPASVSRQVAVHGSVTALEMTIPLLVART
ncbi:nucleotide pyrophosphatase/phosphodiesterase family protein [Luedemannella helvata]|uniref:Alkaline phosphatase family protein n=1 Tax=Luedemannella helvata TaxID=349315 RepID=A0ABP4W2S6_9ACTN